MVEDWALGELRPAPAARLVGYRPAVAPLASVYVPPESHRAHRTGAEDESCVRGPRGPPDAVPPPAPPPLPPPAPAAAEPPVDADGLSLSAVGFRV